MKRKRKTAAVLVGALAVVLLLAPTALAATGGTVTFTARVGAYAAVTQTDAAHVLVRANTPWTLEVYTAAGDTLHIEGVATGGTAVTLPDDAAAYVLAWD